MNGDRVFRLRVTNESARNEWDRRSVMLSSEVGPELEALLPEVESVTRWGPSFGRLRRDDLTVRFNMAYVDSTLFSSLSFDVAHGDQTPLTAPNEIVLWDEICVPTARKIRCW